MEKVTHVFGKDQTPSFRKESMDKFVYIRVADEENPRDSIDVPSEDDGTLLLTTLQAQYPGATGLRYRSEISGNWRGLRISQGIICPPPENWGNTLFYVVRPRTGKLFSDYVLSSFKNHKKSVLVSCGCGVVW